MTEHTYNGGVKRTTSQNTSSGPAQLPDPARPIVSPPFKRAAASQPRRPSA